MHQKTLVREVAEVVLKKHNLYIGKSVYASRSKHGSRAKFYRQKTTTTNIQAELLRATGDDPMLSQYKYRYVSLTSPRNGQFDGLVVGVTNSEAVVTKLCNSGPCIYTFGGVYYHRNHELALLGDFNDDVITQDAVAGVEYQLLTTELKIQRDEEHAKRWAALNAPQTQEQKDKCDAAVAKRVKQINERVAVKQDNEAAKRLFRDFNIARERYQAMTKVIDEAEKLLSDCDWVVTPEALQPIHHERNALVKKWEALGANITN